jgi:hypothetical protein
MHLAVNTLDLIANQITLAKSKGMIIDLHWNPYGLLGSNLGINGFDVPHFNSGTIKLGALVGSDFPTCENIDYGGVRSVGIHCYEEIPFPIRGLFRVFARTFDYHFKLHWCSSFQLKRASLRKQPSSATASNASFKSAIHAQRVMIAAITHIHQIEIVSRG